MLMYHSLAEMPKKSPIIFTVEGLESPPDKTRVTVWGDSSTSVASFNLESPFTSLISSKSSQLTLLCLLLKIVFFEVVSVIYILQSITYCKISQ